LHSIDNLGCPVGNGLDAQDSSTKNPCDFPMGLVGARIVIDDRPVRQFDGSDEVTSGPQKAAPYIGFRYIVSADGHPMPDSIEGLLNRSNRYKIQLNSITRLSRGLHVPRGTVPGQRSLQQMGSPVEQGSLPPTYLDPRRLNDRPGSRQPGYLVQINHFQFSNQAVRVSVDLPEPFGPATTISLGMAVWIDALLSRLFVSKMNDAVALFGSSDISAVVTHGIERPPSFQLSCEVCPDLVAPVHWAPRDLRETIHNP